MSDKYIPLTEIKLLWGKAHNKCAICKKNLTQETKEGYNYIIGEMAHIEGEKPEAARFNPNMSVKDRNKYENLILLCPTCHTTVDNDSQQYTVEKLKDIKKEHAKWAEQSLKEHMPEVTFAELEVILKYLVQQPLYGSEYGTEITVIPPREKIQRNNLSPEVENLIVMGMLQVKQIKDYLNRHPDIQFSERLRAGFVNKYKELKDEGLQGDALFYALLDFALNNSAEFKLQAAGLSILTYFFELCEVLEK